MTKCQLTGSADCEYKNTMDSLEQGTGVIYEFKKSIIDPAEAHSRRLESIKHIAASLVKINHKIYLYVIAPRNVLYSELLSWKCYI